MADFDNRLVRGAATTATSVDAGLRAHMLRVYNYMLAGLALTGAVAWAAAWLICMMRKDRKKTSASGASITTQPRRVGDSATPLEVITS